MKQNLNTKVSQQLASIPPLQISEVHLLCNNLNDEIKQHGNSRIHKQHGSFGKDQVSPAPYLPADIFNITASYICTGKQHCKNHQKQRHKLRLQVCIYLIKDRYFFSRLCRQEYGHSHIDGFWFHCFCNVFCLLLLHLDGSGGLGSAAGKILHGGLRAGDIQDFYTYCATELEISNNTIIKYHANISKALNDAVRLEKIPMTPLKRGMRPKQVEHIGKFYTLSEVEHLLSCVKGDGAEFPVLMAAFYGLRRSEIMGLKWDSIDFDANTITIAHVVVEVSIDGKYTIVAKDRPKNKKSYRTLPLVPEYRRLLLQMKKHQEEYRELCGNCYHESDYIYVNDIGEQIKPNYVTQHFKLVLRKNNLREITFHELRHTCASLLLKSGISMKDIQAWLGHSNYNTTANIYAHLESNSKELTGNAMQGNLTISGNLAAMQE